MKKSIRVPKVNITASEIEASQGELIRKTNAEVHTIDSLNWKEFSYLPTVRFSIAYSNEGIYLWFEVKETTAKATILDDNGPVYNDSCVEFFIDAAGDGTYYNFEINCIGTLLLGYGNSRHNRLQAPFDILNAVKRWPSLGKNIIDNSGRETVWEVSVFLPNKAFWMHSITDFTERKAPANFYKCGDKTAMRHYVSWNPITTEKPDFHRPEFFGELVFTT